MCLGLCCIRIRQKIRRRRAEVGAERWVEEVSEGNTHLQSRHWSRSGQLNCTTKSNIASLTGRLVCRQTSCTAWIRSVEIQWQQENWQSEELKGKGESFKFFLLSFQ